MTDNILEILLKQLDFSEKQIQIYLLLLEKGSLTPPQISRFSKINRSTVYAVCDELILKGVISEDLTAANKTFIPLDPHNLSKLSRQDEKSLETKKARINSAIFELEKISRQSKYVIPKLNFVTEEEIGDFMCKRSTEWDRSIMEHDKIWWGFQDNTFVEHYSGWIDWYWNHSPEKLILRLLSNQGAKENEIRKNYARRHIKYLDSEHNFSSTIWVLGDYTIVIQTATKPFYLFELCDSELSRNLRYLFEKLWAR